MQPIKRKEKKKKYYLLSPPFFFSNTPSLERRSPLVIIKACRSIIEKQFFPLTPFYSLKTKIVNLKKKSAVSGGELHSGELENRPYSGCRRNSSRDGNSTFWRQKGLGGSGEGLLKHFVASLHLILLMLRSLF